MTLLKISYRCAEIERSNLAVRPDSKGGRGVGAVKCLAAPDALENVQTWAKPDGGDHCLAAQQREKIGREMVGEVAEG
jgi:hypothetical protein